jgi:hypothetical protein
MEQLWRSIKRPANDRCRHDATVKIETSAPGKPWGLKRLPIDLGRCCNDRLNPPPKAAIQDVSRTARKQSVDTGKRGLTGALVGSTSVCMLPRPRPRFVLEGIDHLLLLARIAELTNLSRRSLCRNDLQYSFSPLCPSLPRPQPRATPSTRCTRP